MPGGACHACVPADPRAPGDLRRPVRRPLQRVRASAPPFGSTWLGCCCRRERNKTLTALANAEPVVGAQRPAAQRLQWFLSESTWDAAGGDGAPAGAAASRSGHRSARGWGAHHRRDRGPQGWRQDRARRAAVSGQPGQDRAGGGLGGQRVGRRERLLSAGRRALHPSALVRPWARPTPPSAPNRRLPWRWSIRRWHGTGRSARWWPTACTGSTTASPLA